MATQVGEAVIKLTFDGKNVEAQLEKAGNRLKKNGEKSGKGWADKWSVAAGRMIEKGISKVAHFISGSMDSAISRMDTLNNFPRVMTSLGYSAEEADKSISQMDEGLSGLPTTLDGMTSDVQKLAASMGNLADGEVNATSVGLGLNDMFLAGGKGTEAASAAMEQYNQMLARGKVDQQSWNSMVNAAPGQMNQLAESLLGAGKNQADLYKAMQDGTVTFDEFNAAIVKLDKEGGDGFASLHDQAVAATEGLGTQLQNIQTTWTKVVTDGLQGNTEAMGKHLDQLVDRIGAAVPSLVKGVSGAISAIAKVLPSVISELLPVVLQGISDIAMEVYNAIPMIVQMIVDAIPVFVAALTQLLNALVAAMPTVIPQIMMGLVNMLNAIITQLTSPEFLSALLAAAVVLFTEFVKAIPQMLVSLIDALPQIIDNIVTFLTDPANIGMILSAAGQLFMALVMAVPQILGALIGAFGNLVGRLWDWITSTFQSFAANFGNFIGGIFKGAINGVLTFIENFINAPIDLLNGFIGLINDNFGWIGVNIGYIDRVNLPRLAEGGVVGTATTAIIGEDGQEAVLPLEKNTGNWAGLLAQTLADEMQEQGTNGATINVYMTNKIDNRLDAQDIGRVMMQSIRRAA